MRDEELKLEEIEDSHTLGGMVVSRGEGSGEGTHVTLIWTHTLLSYGRVETDTRSVVGLIKKPKDLSPCEREECGHGEGEDVYGTLIQST